ncbi:MAG TPA: ribonuclease J [Candidatus Dormibacteraeota bacterium]
MPLGGLGEVGLNMWALEWEGQVLVVDAGLMFPHEDMPGIDLVIPDISWLLEPGRTVTGCFLTHGHEDHIGALPFLLNRLDVPVYGTRLTLGLLKPKLREQRVLQEADLREVRAGDRVQLGPFRVEPVAVCHSIPDAVALAIETPVGRVVYTSDFKLDSAPLYGPPTDLERFARLGDEGVLLLLSDSTNAERPGRSGSERDLIQPFDEIFEQAPGRIVVATFASNIHRLQHVLELAGRHERRVALVGRSLVRNFETARELGYLSVPKGLVVQLDERVVEDPRLVLLAAGAQGEPVSALARFAARRHPVANVREGDWVVISARPIPGNERLVNQTVNNLYRNGARVFYSELGKVHVSGHAQRDELFEVLRLVKPRFFIPVHGEYRQLHHHAELAASAGLAPEQVLLVEDGRSVEISPEALSLGEPVGAGLVFVDGLGVGDVEEVVLRDRRRLAHDGILLVTVAVDRSTGAVRAGPEIISRGFIEPDVSHEIMTEATAAAVEALRSVEGDHPETSLMREAIHDAVQRVVHKRTKRRPMVIPLVTEL